MNTVKGNGVGPWKFVSSILGSILLTGLGCWFAFGGGVSRTEAIDLIKVHSPYVKEQGVIQYKLDKLQEDIDEIKREVKK